MANYALLVLDLGAPLTYRGIADGLPFDPFAALSEEDEELAVFSEASLVVMDPDDGPLLASPLPRPGFLGRRTGTGPGVRIARGSYAFAQFRPQAASELLEAMEWFVRETWWEGLRLEGPYFLRRLREDGRDAIQLLRRTSA